jgi:UDP-GlcNAc3NAcA epimerase
VKTLTVLGARPQFIKASPVLKLLRNDVLVHTGQHYDTAMNEVFFEELNIKQPDYNLGINGGSCNYQVTAMMQKLEPIMEKERPDAIIVYGDTNSTLAGAIIAKEFDIKLVHIEAGLRSYNMEMPEERNRVMTDKLADLLLCPTENSYNNLAKELLHTRATIVGDTMYDVMMENRFFQNDAPLCKWSLEPKQYHLCTIHRPQNVDNINNLKTIFEALGALDKPVLFPCHPRTAKRLKDVCVKDNVKVIEPMGYMDMMAITANACRVITDSGGLQKEAHILEVPCITLRGETEWVESVNCGANKLCDIDKKKIVKVVNSVFEPKKIHPYGDGDASIAVVEAIYAN